MKRVMYCRVFIEISSLGIELLQQIALDDVTKRTGCAKCGIE